MQQEEFQGITRIVLVRVVHCDCDLCAVSRVGVTPCVWLLLSTPHVEIGPMLCFWWWWSSTFQSVWALHVCVY